MRGLYLASVWLHILAAMTWMGGMVLFVAGVMPYFRHRPEAEKAAFLESFAPRWRAVSQTAFGVLVVTGAFNLWARGVNVSDLFRASWWTTPFAHALGGKLALVLIAAVLTVSHERMTAARARWAGRLLLLVGLAIVAMAVMMIRPAAASGDRVAVAGPHVQGGEWFVQSGCTACHSVSVYGIRNLADTGPDLSLAVEDVPKRFGRSLESFLASPSGTMQMVFSSRIVPTAADRDVVRAKLEEAHRLYRDRALHRR